MNDSADIKNCIHQALIKSIKQGKNNFNFAQIMLRGACEGGKYLRARTILAIAGNSENSMQAAIALEMLHLATLWHDDVIDFADKRRNQSTINNEYNNKIAIMAGDFLLSNLLEIISNLKRWDILQEIIISAQAVLHGELEQQNLSDIKSIDLISYIEIINKKTGGLFVAATNIGAQLFDEKRQDVSEFREIGGQIGMLLQICDDINDYFPGKNHNKSAFNDIKNFKITFPIVYLKNIDNRLIDLWEEKKSEEIIALIKQNSELLQKECQKIKKNCQLAISSSSISENSKLELLKIIDEIYG